MTVPTLTQAPGRVEVRLPSAPPVVRATAAPVRRSRVAAWAVLLIGVVLVVVPIAAGLFVKVASGQQLIDSFEPYLTPDALDQYDADLATLRAGAHGLDATYADQRIATGRFPGIDAYRAGAEEINGRAGDLLARVRAASPDYHRVASIDGFDRVPFLVVSAGLALGYAGGVLVSGRRRGGGAVLLALVAGAALIAYPLVSDLPRGAHAGQRLQHALAPVMTPQTVLREQKDFVVLVHAVGEMDTSFRGVARPGPARTQVETLTREWAQVSSDLASLVGAINDHIADDRALAQLDDLTSPLGLSGLRALPWLLVGTGALSIAAAAAAWPRLRRSTT